MLKLTKKIVLLILLLIFLDRAVGKVLEKMFYKQTHGDDYVSIQLFDSIKSDILVFGSSRASHHYVSDSIEKYSVKTVYNGGRDNMGIHYIYASLKVVLDRYHPNEIILDLIPHNFLKGNQDVKKYYDAQTSVLLPFANRHNSIFETISMIDNVETWKAILIKTYAYNSLIGGIFQNAFTKIGHSQIKGYEPIDGEIDSINYLKPVFPFPLQDIEIDSSAFNVLENCLKICLAKQVKVIIVFSPYYFETPNYDALNKKFSSISKKYNSQIIDFRKDSKFLKNPTLFYDELHLNNSGAVIFSKKLVDSLK